METDTFLVELDAAIHAALAKIQPGAVAGETDPGVGVPRLLQIALRNELEASEEAAVWMTRERDVEVKLALARQCGDEARHYRLIADRLRALGVDPDAVDPQAGGPSPMFVHLCSLETTEERIAAGPYAREALALARNEAFIELCEGRGDELTARLYRETIQPDERHHHELGRRLLGRLCGSPEAQARARAAAERTLTLAGELAEIARLRHGLTRLPGC